MSPMAISFPLLQWGHDKIVMEVGFGSGNVHAGTRLQWGHDKIVMEVSIPDIDQDYEDYCFNGAMTK